MSDQQKFEEALKKILSVKPEDQRKRLEAQREARKAAKASPSR